MAQLLLARLRVHLSAHDADSLKEETVGKIVQDCAEFARNKINPPSIIDFVSQLPQAYMMVLVVAKKILQSGVEYATFERIFEVYKDFHKKVDCKIRKLERAQMLKIFMDLIKMSMYCGIRRLKHDERSNLEDKKE